MLEVLEKVTCDKCGAVIDYPRPLTLLKVASNQLDVVVRRYDFCAICGPLFNAFVEGE